MKHIFSFYFVFFPHHPLLLPRDHGLINYKDTKTKCRLYWCLKEFIDWRYSQSCWYFRPSFVNYCPLTFSLVYLTHPSPLPKSHSTVYTNSVWLGGGVVLSCVGDHILQGFNTLFLTRFRTYKIATPPTKNLV